MVSLSKAVRVLKQHKSHKYRKTNTNCSNFSNICWIIIMLCIYTLLFALQLLKCFQIIPKAQPGVKHRVIDSPEVWGVVWRVKAYIRERWGDPGFCSWLCCCFSWMLLGKWLHFSSHEVLNRHGDVLFPLRSALFSAEKCCFVRYGCYYCRCYFWRAHVAGAGHEIPAFNEDIRFLAGAFLKAWYFWTVLGYMP